MTAKDIKTIAGWALVALLTVALFAELVALAIIADVPF